MTGNDDGGIDPRRLPMRAMLAGEQRRHSTRRDELFLGLLTVISLAVMARLSVPRVFRPESAVISVMLAADTLFCVIVLLDVGTSLLRAENTRDYRFWHGILDLLDSVSSWVSPGPSRHDRRTR